MRAVRGFVLLAVSLVLVPMIHGQEPTQRELLNAVEKQLKQATATAGPAIATIVVSRSEHYPKAANADTPGKLGGFNPKEFLKTDATLERAQLAKSLDLSNIDAIPDHGYAGGVVIDAEGYVLTPYHVIDGATRVYVFLQGGGGSYADIHAADARADLAVLKLITPPAKMTAIKMANVRTVGVGEKKANVFAGKLCVLMASPYSSKFGLGSPIAAFGSITNVRFRTKKPESDTPAPARWYSEYGVFLEFDVKVNAGITGGVLLNLDGEMIGLTNAMAVAWGNAIGPGYAVPVDDHFRRVVEVLRRGEEVEYGFLGVTSPNSRFAPNGDARAIDPIPGGAAALAGIQNGDLIAKVNGIPVESFDDLLLHVGSALAGSKVQISVLRRNRVVELEATLAKYTNKEAYITSVRPDAVFGLRVDYNTMLPSNLPQAQFFGMDERREIRAGVCVREVVAGSPAATPFKTLGDTPTRWLITQVNGTDVTNPAEFIKAAKGQDKLKLTLLDPSETNPRSKELTIP